MTDIRLSFLRRIASCIGIALGGTLHSVAVADPLPPIWQTRVSDDEANLHLAALLAHPEGGALALVIRQAAMKGGPAANGHAGLQLIQISAQGEIKGRTSLPIDSLAPVLQATAGLSADGNRICIAAIDAQRTARGLQFDLKSPAFHPFNLGTLDPKSVAFDATDRCLINGLSPGLVELRVVARDGTGSTLAWSLPRSNATHSAIFLRTNQLYMLVESATQEQFFTRDATSEVFELKSAGSLDSKKSAQFDGRAVGIQPGDPTIVAVDVGLAAKQRLQLHEITRSGVGSTRFTDADDLFALERPTTVKNATGGEILILNPKGASFNLRQFSRDMKPRVIFSAPTGRAFIHGRAAVGDGLYVAATELIEPPGTTEAKHVLYITKISSNH